MLIQKYTSTNVHVSIEGADKTCICIPNDLNKLCIKDGMIHDLHVSIYCLLIVSRCSDILHDTIQCLLVSFGPWTYETFSVP